MNETPQPRKSGENATRLADQFRHYTFELKHLLLIFSIMVFFLVIVSLVQKVSLQNLLYKTQEWYQQDFAERLANLTASSLELLLETTTLEEVSQREAARNITEAFNILLSQQILQKQVEKAGIIIEVGGSDLMIDDGYALYRYFFEQKVEKTTSDPSYDDALALYDSIRQDLKQSEEIYSIRAGAESFHVFVPFVPNGEFVGAVYVKNSPDFSFVTREVIASYDETALIFAALILFGLVAVFYISSYLVNERDEVQQTLFEEREEHLTEQINRRKESMFTKRIYHTHHKAEKVMGFIKEDLRTLTPDNISENRDRVSKYANFMSRVIYDMKWYDPPVQTIRNPLFQTRINEVIRFVIKNIFQRTARSDRQDAFELDLDENFGIVPINEFVVWEIIEPLLQNAIDHGNSDALSVRVQTRVGTDGERYCHIEDNGQGIRPDLLEKNEEGVQRLFLEHISTKSSAHNAGYGCYLAYEISRRCGWRISAENLENGGCRLTLTLPAGNPTTIQRKP
ncbi:MAG TPA: ATP-binding protein [Calditrichia bacterium]|nr:ATP-binding protein [Calditrichia bacterium]